MTPLSKQKIHRPSDCCCRTNSSISLFAPWPLLADVPVNAATLSPFTSLYNHMEDSRRVFSYLKNLDTGPLSEIRCKRDKSGRCGPSLLEIKKLTGGYSARQPVIHDLSFSVSPGEMVGLIGLNGAGKSTTIKQISDFSVPKEGRSGLTVTGWMKILPPLKRG